MTSNSSISIKVNDTHFAQRRIKMELTVNGLVQKTVHVFVVYDRYKWACFVVDHLLEPDYVVLSRYLYLKHVATTDMSSNHLSNDAYITNQLRWKHRNESLFLPTRNFNAFLVKEYNKKTEFRFLEKVGKNFKAHIVTKLHR